MNWFYWEQMERRGNELTRDRTTSRVMFCGGALGTAETHKQEGSTHTCNTLTHTCFLLGFNSRTQTQPTFRTTC